MLTIEEQSTERAERSRQTRHVVRDISFRSGMAECMCGATVRNDVDKVCDDGHPGKFLALAGSPEALKGAFQLHRKAVGAVAS